ncbi:hypothetical protein [Embleya sp. NPDC005971]|uniref:hypothetical protein n=1 Tax=Embleya sp. NPDC005971 TaxID=3156724 RepID=UPI0033D92702
MPETATPDADTAVAQVAALVENMTPDRPYDQVMSLTYAMWSDEGIEHHISAYLVAGEQRAGHHPVAMQYRAALTYAGGDDWPEPNVIADAVYPESARLPLIEVWARERAAAISDTYIPYVPPEAVHAGVLESVRDLAANAIGLDDADLADRMLAIVEHMADFARRLAVWADTHSDEHGRVTVSGAQCHADALARLMRDIPGTIRDVPTAPADRPTARLYTVTGLIRHGRLQPAAVLAGTYPCPYYDCGPHWSRQGPLYADQVWALDPADAQAQAIERARAEYLDED